MFKVLTVEIGENVGKRRENGPAVDGSSIAGVGNNGLCVLRRLLDVRSRPGLHVDPPVKVHAAERRGEDGRAPRRGREEVGEEARRLEHGRHAEDPDAGE